MAEGESTVRRILHFRFTLTGADPAQLLTMMKAAAPMYAMFGHAQMRLLQNVDDPSRFIQMIEYEAPEAVEINRQRIASDPRVQGYLQAWRSMMPGAVEVDVYQEI
jgi:hypothetical protein